MSSTASTLYKVASPQVLALEGGSAVGDAAAPAWLGQTLDALPEGLSVFDAQQRLVASNAAFARLWRMPAELLRQGTEWRAIQAAMAAQCALPACQDQAAHTGLRDWLLADGRVVAVEFTALAQGGCVELHRDITAQRRQAQAAAHQARHDRLTGLANRSHLLEALALQLPRTQRGEEIALICLNLNRFKSVNDTLGHQAGDLLLQQVADRLRSAVRQSDLVSRLGGDEFAVLQCGVSQPTSSTTLGRRLIDTLARPFVLDGQPVQIGASAGVAIGPFDGDTADPLFKYADIALNRARSEGRDTLRYFEPGMDASMRSRRETELDLRAAVENAQFELAYQPLVSLSDLRVVGVEALLRWDHPQRGRVSPADFIPLAEETGLIIPMGRWVLREACQMAASWPESVRVAVNVSPVQFRSPSLVQDVLAALDAARLPASRLELEITEAVLLGDSGHALSLMIELRGHGVRISMDDFGTGYSSLSYLRRFPFDKIKIDRSFVDGVDTQGDALAIVQAIKTLSRALGMSTTVEGVETQAQLLAVQSAGCDEVQGYFFSRPCAPSEIKQLIHDGFRAKAAAPTR